MSTAEDLSQILMLYPLWKKTTIP